MSNDSIAQAPVRHHSSRPRDSQRSKVYKAERTIKAGKDRLETVAEMEKWITNLCKQKRIRSHFPELRRSFDVEDGRGRRAAGGSTWGITMPRWSRSKLVILHEMAHVVIERRYTIRAPRVNGKWVIQVAVHGREYCAVYLKLVHLALGKAAMEELKAAFKAQRVRYTPPRPKRPLSPERREQLRTQLAAARAAKKA